MRNGIVQFGINGRTPFRRPGRDSEPKLSEQGKLYAKVTEKPARFAIPARPTQEILQAVGYGIVVAPTCFETNGLKLNPQPYQQMVRDLKTTWPKLSDFLKRKFVLGVTEGFEHFNHGRPTPNVPLIQSQVTSINSNPAGEAQAIVTQLLGGTAGHGDVRDTMKTMMLLPMSWPRLTPPSKDTFRQAFLQTLGTVLEDDLSKYQLAA